MPGSVLGLVLGGGAVVMLVMGAGSAYLGFRRRYDRKAGLDRAEPVDATVTTATVEETTRSGGYEFGGAYVSHRPVVRFRYEYDGRTYESDDKGWELEWHARSDESEARHIAEEYEEGETVRAYVDPVAPGQAFLERTDDRNLWDGVFLGLGVLFIIAGFSLGLFGASLLG